MINGKKVLVIIPARGGSKGLPRKNIRELCGRPLIGWPISAALNSKYVDRVIVTTDDEAIADVARKEGADVPFLRPAKYATDVSPSSDAILHAIKYCEEECYDYVVLLEPTSPLTDYQDINNAIELLDESNFLSIVGISNVEDCHPEFCVTKSKNGQIKKYGAKYFTSPKRRQELEPIFSFDGSIYISDIETYKKYRTFHHKHTLGYVSESWKKYEIDTLLDFLIVETIMKNLEILREA